MERWGKLLLSFQFPNIYGFRVKLFFKKYGRFTPPPPPTSCHYLISRDGVKVGLIRVKEDGQAGFFKGWQSCSEGFPKGKVKGKS